jgi:hypothetical protein
LVFPIPPFSIPSFQTGPYWFRYPKHSSPQEISVCAVRKRCWMDSGLWQKQQFLSSFQFLLMRLSLHEITPFFKYHMKLLILVGNLARQISWDTLTPLLTKATYIDLMGKKRPDDYKDKDQINMSRLLLQVQYC